MKQTQTQSKSKDNLSVLAEVGKVIIPGRIRPYLRDYFMKAGFNDVPYVFIALVFILSLFTASLYVVYNIFPTLGAVVLPDIGRQLSPVESFGLIITSPAIWLNFLKVFAFLFLALIATLGVVFLLFYLVCEYLIYKRTVAMEKVLPDFLRQVSQNLKAGLTLEKSLWAAIDPVYKELSYEIRLLAKRVMVGEDLSEGLLTFGKKYKSPELLRTFSLLSESNKSGSEMAYIVDRVVESLEKTKSLKDEIRATSSAYMIFISFIVVVIMPLLFTLAYNLIIVLEKISKRFANIGDIQGMPINLSNLNITVDTTLVGNFMRGAVILSAISAAMLISIISEGDLRSSIKYILLYTVLSFISFTLIFSLLNVIFAGLFGAL
ncbi:MAG TPA: type II secretion system F family protein [Candidatus Woesearchaeota archaeon]|jgi:pilus assembly protein TadC|nr:type II secretion system F family protein [Candidatus Woesearchaeota archaeon]